jgi:hypothetical protein
MKRAPRLGRSVVDTKFEAAKEMKSLKTATVLFCFAVLAMVFGPIATADEMDKKTILGFNAPGQLSDVILPPGTYVFKLPDSLSERNIAQVFEKDEAHLFATFLTIHEYRVQLSDKTILSLASLSARRRETSAGCRNRGLMLPRGSLSIVGRELADRS